MHKLATIAAVLIVCLILTPAQAAVYKDFDPVLVSNGTEVTIAEWEINQNQFQQGYAIKMLGRVNSKASPAGNLTLRFKSGANVFSTAVIALPANLSQEIWILDVLASVEGLSENSAYLDCTGKIELVSSTANGVKILPVAMPPRVDLAENPTFSVTMQFGTSHANNTAVREKAVIVVQ